MGGDLYDVIVLGSGPAGLQAAVHAARRKARVLVLGRASGSSCLKAEIGNLVGLGARPGEELLRVGREQAARAGAELREEDAVGLAREGDAFAVRCESGETFRAKTLVLATGVSLAKLGVPGEKELLGKGVSHCVDCDAGFFKGKPVAVTGDGSAAAEGALLMLRYASEVHLVTKGLACAEKLKGELASSVVVVHSPDAIARIAGADSVEGAELESGARLDVKGVFVELGAKGVLALTVDLGVALDPESLRYVVVDRKQRTNVEGVFAAGDVTGPPWQVAKALGEGCVAGLEAAAFARKAGK